MKSKSIKYFKMLVVAGILLTSGTYAFSADEPVSTGRHIWYPNGTVYIALSGGDTRGSHAVTTANGEVVFCKNNPERCKQLLEEATDAVIAGGGVGDPVPGRIVSDGDGHITIVPDEAGGGKDNDKEVNSKSTTRTSEKSEFRSFFSKHEKGYFKAAKKRFGVWMYSKGKWQFVVNPKKLTMSIIKKIR